jgi:hypothetical protein
VPVMVRVSISSGAELFATADALSREKTVVATAVSVVFVCKVMSVLVMRSARAHALII